MHLCMLPLREKGIPVNPPNRDALELVIDTLLMDHYGLSEDHWIVQQARKSI